MRATLNQSTDPEDVLVSLSELSGSTFNPEEPIDDLVVEAFHILKKDHLKEFLDVLYDLFVGMRDPRNIVVHLLNCQKEGRHSLLVSKSIYFVIENYDFQFNDFYANLKESLNFPNLSEDTEEKLSFIVNVLYDNRAISVGYMKEVVKRLAGISLESSSEVCVGILYALLFILRSNPVLYKMVEGGDIHEEIEIHRESIVEISTLANRIKREATDKEFRVKFVNLTAMKFPRLCV